MDKLHFLGMTCKSMFTYSVRNIKPNKYCHFLHARHCNLLQVKRYKHLCRLSKKTSLISGVDKTGDLTHKLNSPNWNAGPMATSINCLPNSRSTTLQTRMFSTSPFCFNDNKDDDILKDDPYLKDLLKEIREDFSSYSGSLTNQPVAGSENKMKENSHKIVDENKTDEDENSSSSDSDFSSLSSDSSSSEEEDDFTSDFEEDNDFISHTEQSGKPSPEKQATATEPDLHIGGFISLDPVNDFEEVEEFPDTFEPEKDSDWKSPIDLKRGVTGVFDVEELVVLLRADNAKDICVMRMPDHLKLGDYIVIVTAWSYRHMKALTKNIISTYKLKKHPSDRYPLVSGVDDGQWAAFDLGNIILHVFKEEVREMYDLETLWAVGPKFDEKSQEIVNPYILEDTDMNWLREFYEEKEEK